MSISNKLDTLIEDLDAIKEVGGRHKIMFFPITHGYQYL